MKGGGREGRDADPQVKAVRVTCHAKLNLYLKVLAREASGYHQIESVFQAISLNDHLDLDLAPEGVLEVKIDTGADPNIDEQDNTVVTAIRLLLERTASPAGVRARLEKGIPAGTGLGGGSSDAAGALLGLNRLLGHPLTGAELVELGGQVGADVAYFCVGAPTAIVWGRGGRVLPQVSPKEADVVVCVPKARVATGTAYRELSAALELPRPAASLGRDPTRDWERLNALQHNDFEQTAFKTHEVLASIRAGLEEAGADVARMTGSGSALFGIFGRPEDAKVAQAELAGRDEVDVVLVAKTLTTGPLNPVEARR